MNEFSWSDQSQFLYSNWINNWNSSTDTKNKCTYLAIANSLWNVTNCDSQYDFICKISKGSYIWKVLFSF